MYFDGVCDCGYECGGGVIVGVGCGLLLDLYVDDVGVVWFEVFCVDVGE